MAGPLEGLKVVEMAGLGPCPLAGQLLADLGAEVIVITRKSAKADPADINNRSKRSIALNLKSNTGLEVAGKLIARADVLIEGFRPGVMEKLGLGPSECHESNPALVYGRMTGWGQEGPLSSRAGHDINYLSITGALHAIGRPDQPPVPPLNLVADYGGGTMFLVYGVLCALLERAKSGRGQVVDAAMVDGVPAMMGLLQGMMMKGQWSEKRGDNLLDGGAPFYRCYETADGRYVSLGCLEPQFFAEFVRLAGLDEGLLSRQYDRESWPHMHAEFEQYFLSHDRDVLDALFSDSDACVAPVLKVSEAAKHPHNQARGIFRSSNAGISAAPAPRFSRTQPKEPGSAPAPGEHSEMVLSELGYDSARIEQLRSEGVIT